MKIEITTDEDSHDCETCGWDYATGGTVHIDGVEVVNLPAQAHCYDGQSFSDADLLVIALRKLGHTVEMNGTDWHINCVYDDG